MPQAEHPGSDPRLQRPERDAQQERGLLVGVAVEKGQHDGVTLQRRRAAAPLPGARPPRAGPSRGRPRRAPSARSSSASRWSRRWARTTCRTRSTARRRASIRSQPSTGPRHLVEGPRVQPDVQVDLLHDLRRVLGRADRRRHDPRDPGVRQVVELAEGRPRRPRCTRSTRWTGLADAGRGPSMDHEEPIARRDVVPAPEPTPSLWYADQTFGAPRSAISQIDARSRAMV